MLYYIRVEPLRRDVKAREVEDVLRDFGTIYRVVIHRASPHPRYNKLSKKKDIFDGTYAVVSFTDRHACFVAKANLHNTIVHPITRQNYAIVPPVKMGQVQVRRSLRIYEHVLNKTYGAR
ncbi:hypothetical protein AAVH_38159 [Aphelenchoides avenae]|nr:hypothetical protein AAVH_38159 [Aphelenchus avenae]